MLRNRYLSAAALVFTCGAFAVAQAPPALDELSDTKLKLVLKSMEVAQMQQSIAAQNVAKAREEMQQLVIATEAKYPGFTINIQNGALTPKQVQAPARPELKDPHTGQPIPDGTPLPKK